MRRPDLAGIFRATIIERRRNACSRLASSFQEDHAVVFLPSQAVGLRLENFAIDDECLIIGSGFYLVIRRANQMRPPWWTKVRHADNIPKADRDMFGRYGENVIASAIAAGQHSDKGPDLNRLSREPETQKHAPDWLTERADLRLQREDRRETVEWVILVVAVMTLVVSVMTVFAEVWCR
jgi:hypothetical protein